MTPGATKAIPALGAFSDTWHALRHDHAKPSRPTHHTDRKPSFYFDADAARCVRSASTLWGELRTRCRAPGGQRRPAPGGRALIAPPAPHPRRAGGDTNGSLWGLFDFEGIAHPD